MLSTRLTNTDNGILSNEFIPENIRSLIERRTENNKRFGKLEILTPQIEATAAAAAAPRNIIAGFLLDTSASMSGTKIEHARDTIKKLVEVLHSERNGNTIEQQPFHSWIYVISFNSVANVIIPFQEITDETLPGINSQMDTICASGSTNYAKAFQKQNDVIEDIITRLNNPDQESAAAAAAASGQFHFIRFFETDGDITEGSSNATLLYNMMRSVKTSATATATAARITYEDVILGYGTDVNLECLKKLASPYAPENEYNCSSLVTIIKPEDIGWQVGEILFKVIMRYGSNVNISIAAATAGDDAARAELFEYQTHQWSSSTTLHSFIHGDNKQIWIQYTPGAATAADATPRVNIQIQYENQFTGETYTYQFAHDIQNVVVDVDTPPPLSAAIIEKTITLLNGMVQIEIFKQFREIESTRYDKDTIVSEAYKTMRMLKTIDAMTRAEFPTLSCQTLNLMTDVKVIIGLTTVENQQEQNIILHARRICSAENEVFNTGATLSRKYVENEEEHEEEAKRVIKAAAAANDDATAPTDYVDDYYESDALPSRIESISTQLVSHETDTPFYGGGGNHYYNHYHHTGSEVRTLCVKIAIARANNEDVTAEQLYEQMRAAHHHHDYNEYDAPCHQDDTFSSTPMNDDYTQRRMGMMRRMS